MAYEKTIGFPKGRLTKPLFFLRERGVRDSGQGSWLSSHGSQQGPKSQGKKQPLLKPRKSQPHQQKPNFLFVDILV